MFEYELHKIRAAELIRQADHHRLVREIREAGRRTEQAERSRFRRHAGSRSRSRSGR
ncbi:hypothetical protein ACIOJD_01045 [Streptomyces sp. NPDC088116]|uniref:hypothetical protein n=1 Tax=Streptomyces sp. NPDC088116 TaxID=3365825 RepID=UPI0038220F78